MITLNGLNWSIRPEPRLPQERYVFGWDDPRVKAGLDTHDKALQPREWQHDVAKQRYGLGTATPTPVVTSADHGRHSVSGSLTRHCAFPRNKRSLSHKCL